MMAIPMQCSERHPGSGRRVKIFRMICVLFLSGFGIVSTLYQSQHPTFAPVHCARIASALRDFTQKSHALNACGKEGYYDADALSGKPPIARQHWGRQRPRPNFAWH